MIIFWPYRLALQIPLGIIQEYPLAITIKTGSLYRLPYLYTTDLCTQAHKRTHKQTQRKRAGDKEGNLTYWFDRLIWQLPCLSYFFLLLEGKK